MLQQLRPAAALFLLLSLLTGLAYPGLVTALAQLAFADAANGSLISIDGKPVGSALLGQPFSEPQYFWPRPSASGGSPYNAQASGGSNYGPSHPDLAKTVAERVKQLGGNPTTHPVPVDLVTSSGSGLDPDISLAAAYFQVERVAAARGKSKPELENLIERYAQRPWLGLFGEARVNVLTLNLALDGKL